MQALRVHSMQALIVQLTQLHAVRSAVRPCAYVTGTRFPTQLHMPDGSHCSGLGCVVCGAADVPYCIREAGRSTGRGVGSNLILLCGTQPVLCTAAVYLQHTTTRKEFGFGLLFPFSSILSAIISPKTARRMQHADHIFESFPFPLSRWCFAPALASLALPPPPPPPLDSSVPPEMRRRSCLLDWPRHIIVHLLASAHSFQLPNRIPLSRALSRANV